MNKKYRSSDGNPWVIFRRIENEDGSFQWTNWTTGWVNPTRVNR